VLVACVQALATLTALSLATLAPVVSKSLGLETRFVGYQVSLIYVSGAAISLVSGALVRRWGAVGVSQCALLLCIVGLLGIAIGNVFILVLGSLLIGAGYGMTNPAASHLLFRLTSPGHRNLLFSLKQTSVPLGGIVAGLMLPPLTKIGGWKFALLVCACLSGLMVALLNIHRKQLDADKNPNQPLRKNIQYDLAMLCQHKGLLRLSIMAFCFSATQLSLMSFAVSMLVEDLSRTLVLAGTIVSLMQGFGAVGRIAWGVFADKVSSGLPVLILIGCLSIAACLVMTQLNTQWPLWAVIIVMCVFGFSAIGWNGVFLAEVARMSQPEQVSTMTGMALFFTFSGVVIGPSLFSLICKFVGSYLLTFGVLSIFPAVGTILLFGMRKEYEKI
jgi:MFS family permease